jgi:hypothetical protein
MERSRLRAWWFHRQGLDGTLSKSSASDILARTGWARSVGGASPYLTLFARGGIGRQAADDAAARLEILELPSARNCTYVVPACDFALALKVGQSLVGEMRTAVRLGVAESEIDKLCLAVIDALARGPLDPEELHKAAGGAVRNLGEAGKKKGLTTTLPVALGKLQSAGEIRRISMNGRIDHQRYRYALWRPNPLSKCRLTTYEAYRDLARRFFDWIGPATAAEFQWFSGLGVKAAKAAMDPLGLEPVERGSDYFMGREVRADFLSFRVPNRPKYVLVSSLDGICHLRRDVEGILAPEDRKHTLICENGLTDLADHAILDRGRLIGLWEYDVDTASIAWMSFVPRNRALETAVARTEEFIRSEVGDARSFSLDSPRSRAPRIAMLRAASF